MASILAILLLSLIVIVVGLPFLLRALADGDVLFTTVQEGTAKAIMRGEGFDHFVMAFEGHHLNDPRKRWYDSSLPKWEVLPNIGPDNFYDDRGRLVRWLGLHWVGIPFLRTVYVYPFQWKEFAVNPATGEECVRSRNESTNFIYVKDFPYAVQMTSIKTIDPLPVDVIYLLTTWTNNPYLALFKTEDWLKQITAVSDRRGRDFIGSRTFSMINSELGAENGDHPDAARNFSKPIIALTHQLPDDGDGFSTGLAQRYGQSIRTADLLDVDLSGAAAAEHERTSLDVYTSVQEATATRNRGTAEADVIFAKQEAEAKGLKTRLATLNEYGALGELLAQLDAMQANGEGKTIIWANNPLIGSTGLMSTLAGLGINSPDDLRKFMEDKK